MSAGFLPLDLALAGRVDIPSRSPGTNWDILGSVPDSAGLYLFTLEDTAELRVVCAGRTDHLWGPMGLVTDPRGGRDAPFRRSMGYVVETAKSK